MFSRRVLRIKALHAIYAYRKNPDIPVEKAFAQLRDSILAVHEMYRFYLFLIGQIHEKSGKLIEEKKQRKFPKPDDIALLEKIWQNPFMKVFADIPTEKLFPKKSLPFNLDDIADTVHKITIELFQSEFLKTFNPHALPISKLKELPEFLIKEIIYENEYLHTLFDKKNIHFQDTEYYVLELILKGLHFYTSGEFPILPVYRDEKEDPEFLEILFYKTILNEKEIQQYIKSFLENWELDRLAETDLVLMEMCITEFVYLKEIPIKASLNEYIEISKEYSTPNSRIFINGILDKISKDLTAKGKIKKEGKGLKEE
ncbi:MAG: transcription antitermination factor NusB [Bacteroidia bacterium]|nr:transcription antitermination factor NusB [Bacteroidia bacterium]